MGLTDRIFNALTAMVRLEEKVKAQADAMKSQSDTIRGQQQRIEDLTGRLIRLEAQLDMLMAAAQLKRLG